MPSSSAGDAPPWSAGTPGWARNVINPWARRISRLATLSSALLPPWPLRNTSRSAGGGGDAAADVVEHRQQRGRRQPDRAGRPGVLVATSCTAASAAATGRARRRASATAASATAVATSESVLQRQVRPVLLDRAERLDDDAAVGEPRGDLGPRRGRRAA